MPTRDSSFRIILKAVFGRFRFTQLSLVVDQLTMSSFIALNTEAVALMQQGNDQAATMLLWRALEGLKGGLRKASVISSLATETIQPRASVILAMSTAEVAQNEEIDCDVNDASHNPSLHSVSIPGSELCMDGKGWDQKNIFIFYPRAFILDETPQNQEDATRVAAVVLYNLALIQHVRALQNNEGDCRFVMLSRAGGLYKAAQDIACTGWNQDACLDLYCLPLALASNLGHIYGHSHQKLSDFSKMRDCLNCLIELVTFPEAPAYLSEDDFEFFYMVIVIFQESPGLTLAPAA
jgi:hypothetical protein